MTAHAESGVMPMIWRRAGLSALAVAALLGVLAHQLLPVLSFPNRVRMLPGQTLPLYAGPLVRVEEMDPSVSLSRAGGRSLLTAMELGAHRLRFSLFGIPLRVAQVEVVPRLRVMVGGEAIGVLLTAQGLVIARTVPVMGVDGREHAPAEQAGLLRGDVLLQADGQVIHHPGQLQALAERAGRAGRPLVLTIRRQQRTLTREVQPVLTRDSEGQLRYVLGLYLEQSAAGVGTLTFWDPASRRYGALGHMITRGETLLDIPDGRIVPAYIQGIQKGARGRPGEKLGLFDESRGVLGTIDKNTPFGIYGTLNAPLNQPYYQEPVEVALAHEVKRGSAEILTVVEGERVERFRIEILEVSRQQRPDGKGLVIKVVDPRLLARTNGIVQGMSGSPILQGGRLVGAVTHVFLNDPTRGFGILAEWMAYEAGLGAPSRPQRLPAAS